MAEKARKRKNTIQEGNKFATFMLYFAAVIVMLITLYPMYYVIIMSISDPIDVAAKNVFLYPTGFVTKAYEFVMKDDMLWRSLVNTIFYVILTTGIHLFVCVTFAYPLAMPRLKGRTFFVWFLIVPMYFNGGLIPSFLVMTKILKLYNKIWAIILPASVAIYHIILTRTYFFSSVPHTLREAAMIDGANHYQTLGRIYLPLSKPILAVIAIYTIVDVWNTWFSSMVYLTDAKLHPVQLYLKQMLVDGAGTKQMESELTGEELEEFLKMQMVKMQLQYAVIVITTLPVLVVYPFLQKYFVKGVMIGSLKG